MKINKKTTIELSSEELKGIVIDHLKSKGFNAKNISFNIKPFYDGNDEYPIDRLSDLTCDVEESSDIDIKEFNNITDEQYIQVYEKLGSDYYGKGTDDDLRRWGNSDERINRIKAYCVKSELDFHEKGINTYKLLNELAGGVNKC